MATVRTNSRETGIWRHHADARPGSTGPGHRAAMRATIDMYTEWRIERLKLRIEGEVRGYSIESWRD